MQDLMRETEEVATRRKSCLEMRELLSKALDIVNEVRDQNYYPFMYMYIMYYMYNNVCLVCV